jgi:GLPGLI family protein
MKLAYLFVHFLLFLGYSQNTLVEYQYLQDGGDKVFNFSHYLLVNDKESYYVMPPQKNYKSYEDFYSDNEYKSSNTRRSIYKRQNEDNIYSYTYIPKPPPLEEKFIKDEIKNNYKFIDGEEKILGYTCKLASVKFRGRDYKVWYTLDIPLSEGPWKFFGLPGLILKVEERHRLFIFEATRIVLNGLFLVPEKIKKSYNDLSLAISYKDYIRLENESLSSIRDKALSSLPKGTILKNPRPIRYNLNETEFEWEESKKP